MFRFSILIQVTEPANVERDFCKERKGRKRLLPLQWVVLEKVLQNLEFYFFYEHYFHLIVIIVCI